MSDKQSRTEQLLLAEQVRGLETISKQLTAIDNKLWWMSLIAKIGIVIFAFWFVSTL